MFLDDPIDERVDEWMEEWEIEDFIPPPSDPRPCDLNLPKVNNYKFEAGKGITSGVRLGCEQKFESILVALCYVNTIVARKMARDIEEEIFQESNNQSEYESKKISTYMRLRAQLDIVAMFDTQVEAKKKEFERKLKRR